MLLKVIDLFLSWLIQFVVQKICILCKELLLLFADKLSFFLVGTHSMFLLMLHVTAPYQYPYHVTFDLHGKEIPSRDVMNLNVVPSSSVYHCLLHVVCRWRPLLVVVHKQCLHIETIQSVQSNGHHRLYTVAAPDHVGPCTDTARD